MFFNTFVVCFLKRNVNLVGNMQGDKSCLTVCGVDCYPIDTHIIVCMCSKKKL